MLSAPVTAIFGFELKFYRHFEGRQFTSMAFTGLLRENGIAISMDLTDINIADIALAASFRNFLSRYFDAIGAEVEPDFLDSDLNVRSELSVGSN